ncbi:hypothetical protein B0H16DRAFT_1602500 [Mycena metata]|uniref:Uncharacterized protein n=1 Tax=Mycena metata TaxID=1033252 RepID=A0AAD7MKL8_9AGAR|nr:hypothetical protein B0H16DRAFT_1602500 [Mycena metata]
MIIVDDTPESKASTPLLGSATASGSGDLPPAYAPREDSGLLGSAQVPYSPHQPIFTQKRAEPAGKRFCKALLVAVAVWCLVSALAGSFIGEQALGHGYTIPRDINTGKCVTEWEREVKNSSFPYAVSTTFDFALPSKALLFLSGGKSASGHLKIQKSENITTRVQVKVIVNYYQTTARDSAKVCTIRRNKGEIGVGLFTPTYWRPPIRTDDLSFDVVLTLPHSQSTQYINGLATEMDNFSHDVDTMNGILFGQLRLSATNGHIVTQDIAAEAIALITSDAEITSSLLVASDAKVRSSNGHISGVYNVSNSLELYTTNADIVAAAIVNANHSDPSTKSVSMVTSNGILNAQINLGLPDSKPAAFVVETVTTNTDLMTAIVSAPFDSSLTVAAQTSNGRAYLGLPSTYEGRLLASTTNEDTFIKSPQFPDPACKGHPKCTNRKRSLQVDTIIRGRQGGKGLFDGSVFWDEKNAARSEASVSTSNAAVLIVL